MTFSLSPPHPQRAVLVVSLTNKRKICHPPQREVLFVSLTFSLSPPTLNEQCSLSRWQIKKNLSPPQREVLFVSLTFFPLPPHPLRALLVVSLTNKHEKLYEYISLVIFYLFVFFSVLNLYIISTIEMEYQLLYTTVGRT